MLVKNAGGQELTPERLHDIELFGRSLAGVGLVLLVAQTLSGWLGQRGGIARVLGYTAIIVLCWPLMFFGQKYVIETVLIEPSAAEERQRAHFTQLLRTALASNSLEIEGLDLSEDRINSPAARTFLTIFGGLVYADHQLVASLEEQRAPIMRSHLRQAAAGEFDAYWAEYEEFVAEVRSSYRSYAQAASSYHDRMESTDDEVARYREIMESEVQSGWQEYRSTIQAFNARVRARAEQAAPVAYQYFETVSGTCNAACEGRARTRYDHAMARLHLDEFEPRHWLIVEEVSTRENVGRAMTDAVLTLGISAAFQVLDRATGGDGGWESERFKYTNDVDHYEERIRPTMVEQFLEESDGYEPDIESIAAFRSHGETNGRVRARIVREGLDLPDDWQLSDRRAFESAVDRRVNSEIRAEWDREMRARGLDVGPDLTYAQFERLPSIQDPIRRSMGENYVSPMRTTWDREAFRQNVVEPGIDREVRDTIQELEADVASFADGARYETAGKDALRAVLVPPIAMVLSLFLVVFSLGKVLFKGVELVLRWRLACQIDAGDDDAALARVRRRLRFWTHPVSTLTQWAVLLAALAALPAFLQASEAPDTTDGPIDYLIGNLESESQAGIAYAADWALQVQPVILPIGLGVNNAIGAYEGFTALNPLLGALDDALMPRLLNTQPSSGPVATSGNGGVLHHTTANSLRVRDAPTTAGSQVGVLPLGTAVEVVGEEADGWVRIRYRGDERFVHGDFLRPE